MNICSAVLKRSNTGIYALLVGKLPARRFTLYQPFNWCPVPLQSNAMHLTCVRIRRTEATEQAKTQIARWLHFVNIKCSSSVCIVIDCRKRLLRESLSNPIQYQYRLRKIGDRVASTAEFKNQRQLSMWRRLVPIFWAYLFPRRTTKHALHSFTKVPSLLIIASSDIVKHVWPIDDRW